jgi:Raf kinase inhibitor-like YbhB/YbcL family protein
MRDADFIHLELRETLMAFEIRSPAFSDGGKIPRQYTCEGADTSPPLEWSGVPDGTQSLALIVDDPDAPDPAKPQRVYVHWVVYNIAPSSKGFSENDSAGGAHVGNNDWGKKEYGGPCPPIGRHRYFFKLYALDTTLELKSPSKKELESAMEGHILGNAVIMGTYKKGD